MKTTYVQVLVLLAFTMNHYHVARSAVISAAEEDEAEDGSGETASERRSVVGDLEDKENLQKIIIAYGYALGTLLGMASNPVIGLIGSEVVPMFTDILTKVISGDEGDSDVWTQLEERIDSRIANELSSYHFGTLLAPVKKIESIMKRKSITKKDLDGDILAIKDQFLPQTFERIGFNSRWVTAFPSFVVYLNTFMLRLMKEKKMHKCSLGKEMEKVRAETIEAAKALYRSRFRSIIGTKSNQAWPKREPCQGAGCAFAQWLTYHDDSTGKLQSEVLTDVERYILRPIAEETEDIVWKNMVSKINAFLNESLCLCANHCPKPIERKEVRAHYPTTCYGKLIKETPLTECVLPCHAYGEGYEWCPTDKPHNNLLGSNWAKCERDKSFAKCFPVKGTKIFGDI